MGNKSNMNSYNYAVIEMDILLLLRALRSRAFVFTVKVLRGESDFDLNSEKPLRVWTETNYGHSVSGKYPHFDRIVFS